MSARHPVLLPPEDAPRGRISPWVPWIAVLGVAVTGLVAVPASLERRRLDAVHAGLRQQIRAQEGELERLEAMEREAGVPSYLRERALRRLLAPRSTGPEAR